LHGFPLQRGMLHIIGREADRYVRAWTFGDTKTMESLIIEGMPEEVKLSSIPEKLFDARNRDMASKIEEFFSHRLCLSCLDHDPGTDERN
jgi:5-deoxy-D-glucuronate isomerase